MIFFITLHESNLDRMKKIQLLFTLVFAVFSLSLSAQKVKYQKANFVVSGKCEMCKTKIEATAKLIEGVKTAKWNVVNGKMKVKFNPELTNLDQIQEAIAEIGYDTEKYRAEDEVYNKLHYCCKYERTLEK